MTKLMKATAWMAVFCLTVILGCGDSTTLPTGGGGGGNGNGGGGIDGPYELAPFRFYRHSVTILGGRYGASVGMFGQAFFTHSGGHAFVPTGTRVPLNDVWHTGSVDTMFVAGGFPLDDSAYIIRFLNGERTSMPHPIRGTVAAIDGHYWNRLFAVGANGVIAEYRGEDFWATFWVEDGASFTDIWVAAPDNFWVSGGNGGVFHYDGSDLVDESIGGIDPVWSIVGVDPDTVYAVAGDEIYEIAADGTPRSVFTEPEGNELLSIGAAHSSWIVAVGAMGRVAMFNGLDWDSDWLFTNDDLTAVWVSPIAAEVWGAEGAHYYYFAGWRPQCISDVKDWDDVHVYARGEAYGLLDGKLWGWGQSTADWQPAVAVPNVHLGGLFAVGANQVWAYDIPTGIDHFAYYISGGPAQTYWIGSMDTPSDIWCDAQDEVLMVGPYGSAWRFNPATSNFSQGSVVVTNKNLNGVWGYSWNNIFAVGDEGTIVTSVDGAQTWTAMTSNTTANLNDVWGWDDDHLVAVGDNGTVMVYNPPSATRTWSLIPTGVTDNLEHVWTGGADDIWVADGGDLIMRYDGSSWTRYGNLPNVRVKGISGNMGTPPMFVCDEDFVFQYQPAAE
jgi:hypothetical protein